MSVASAPPAAPPVIALLGNPNTGKSTLFNALAGARQRVGNYPGCTVEKKTGHMTHAGRKFELVDLPGTYSLAPRSPDEMVAVDLLLGRRDDVRRPEALVCIVDASNLERNLYLVSQALELGLPTVLALNMTDVARERGVTIDVKQLSQRLSLPVIEMQAHVGLGVDELKAALATAIGAQLPAVPESSFPPAFQDEVHKLTQTLADQAGPGGEPPPRYLVERLLLDTSGYLAELLGHDLGPQLTEARARLGAAGVPVPAVEALARYGWVAKMLEGVVQRPAQRPRTASDKLDRILTHKWLGTGIFAALMLVVFQAVFSWAVPFMDAIDEQIGALGELVTAVIPPGAFQSLLVDGVIAGVGGVLVFLPQILILFFFIGILEDCGYMARAAFLMDKLMAGVGLSGKSFIPLLSSFACAIPGVMATRVIENRRDRLATILVAPLMSCSARIPVYVLLCAAFIPQRSYLGGLLSLTTITFAAMYLIGILAAVFVALILKKTILRGETPPFVMELPSYKWPSVRTVIWRMTERGWSFIRRAGTMILAVSIVVWFLAYFPHDDSQVDPALFAARDSLEPQVDDLAKVVEPQLAELLHLDIRRKLLETAADWPEETPWPEELPPDVREDDPALQDPDAQFRETAALRWQRQQELLAETVQKHTELAKTAPEWEDKVAALRDTENAIEGSYVRHSYLGRMGQWIEPVVLPLGWDWRIGAAAIASFPAREVIVATLGVIYNLGSEETEESHSLQQALRDATWDEGSARAGRPVYSVPVALSIMVFFSLCAQCAATLAVIRRETNSWGWPAFTFTYMTLLAYVAALVTYQVTSLLGW